MTRILVVLVVLAGLVSVATCFTTTTTKTTISSNSCNHNKRKQDLNVRSRKSFHIQKQPVVVSFPISTTLLFEGKESSTSTSTTDSTDSTMLDGVVELGGESTTIKETNDSPSFIEQAVAPFLSQGEIDPQTLNPDLSDPKQARVIIYIILSLVPVLFLIPLMIGSRDLIPLDAVAPVQL